VSGKFFDLTVEGLPTAEVGRRLWISPRTVETHRARILQKLRALDRRPGPARGRLGMLRE
jgi:FixJ family two-component response regulator